jgi:hypothetical protein
MNLKKLATWLWKSGGSKHKIRDFVLQMVKIYNKLPSRQKETREFVFSLRPAKICRPLFILFHYYQFDKTPALIRLEIKFTEQRSSLNAKLYRESIILL